MTGANAEHRRALPFLRWAGGKSWLAPKLAELFPNLEPARYLEPFLGSGAVFFGLRPESATLSDLNADLINAYEMVRDQPHELVAVLGSMKAGRESYYRVRKSHPQTPLRRAARFLYLNRLGFNGIYRVNRQGVYNVPFGGHDRKLQFFWHDDRLLLASKALSGVELRVADFSEVLASAGAGDLAYCDPVYLVRSVGESFSRYTHTPFDQGDLRRLGSAVDGAVQRGAVIALSWPSGTRLDGFPKPRRDLRLERQSTVSARATAATRRVERLVLFGDPSSVR
ncbi:MAG TPA: DNA adenine methylase [Acidimicrobiales bacterium]|nr:DNA adenine methylase [Acidimicrobiales bacterium]